MDTLIASSPYAAYLVDPRPDLVDDSAVWHTLFTLVEASPETLGTLHAVRCQGTRLRCNTTLGRWELHPQCDAENWPDLASYQDIRHRFLAPLAAIIGAALKQLPTAYPGPWSESSS